MHMQSCQLSARLCFAPSFLMDHRSGKDEDAEVDLESGLAPTEGNTKQGEVLFTKISCIKGEDRYNGCCNESKLSVVSMDMVKVTNKLYSVECAENNTPVKEKRKKSSNKKALKPPRPPRAPSLDAADHKLIREITELALLKRARIERMKALKKMKAAKASSSSSSSMFAMVFTVVFCIVILLQGMSSGKSSVASFQGSPVPAGVTEGGLIDIQHQLNPSSSYPNAPGLEPHKIVQQVTGSDLPAKLRRDAVTARMSLSYGIVPHVLLTKDYFLVFQMYFIIVMRLKLLGNLSPVCILVNGGVITSSATACCIHLLKFRVRGDFAFEASQPYS
ncbi:hypothetical protein CR513_23566, partial [Mucuna pruriens]